MTVLTKFGPVALAFMPKHIWSESHQNLGRICKREASHAITQQLQSEVKLDKNLGDLHTF